MHGMRFGTARKKPARPVTSDGFAPQALRSVREWGKQFDVPILRLTPIDTVKQLVLNRRSSARCRRRRRCWPAPTRPGRRWSKNSRRSTSRDGRLRPRTRRPARHGRSAHAGARRDPAGDSVGQADARAARPGETPAGGIEAAGEPEVSCSARECRLSTRPGNGTMPSPGRCSSCRRFSAPDIGNAFFGKVSIDRFQKALYWAELARHYMPPGLLPREEPAAKRLRADGVNVRFPKEHAWPPFLCSSGRWTSPSAARVRSGVPTGHRPGIDLRAGALRQADDCGASRSAAGSAIAGIDVAAVVDHRTASVRDSAAAQAPRGEASRRSTSRAPFRLEPGIGAADLTFALRGDQLRGHWGIGSTR